MKNKFLTSLAAACIILLCACNQPQKNGAKEVAIACNLPLTGDFAVYGEAVQNGVTFALEDLKKGKQLDTVMLKFDIQDNKSNNTDAVSILNKQLLNSPQVYVSGLDHQTSAMIGKITQSGIPHFTYSWEPFICKKGPNNFRTGINLEQESDYYVAYLKNKMPKKLCIIHINDPGSFLQFDSLVIPRAKALGIKDIHTEIFNLETNDFKTIAAKVKAYGPDAMLVAGYDTHEIVLIKDFRNYGLIKGDNLMCSVDLLDASVNLTPQLLEGIRFTCPQFVSNTNDNSDWKKRFEARFKKPARYGDAYAYDMTSIIYNAAKHADGDFSPKSIITQINKTDINGITGHLSFNPNRDLNLNLHVCYFKNGVITKENF